MRTGVVVSLVAVVLGAGVWYSVTGNAAGVTAPEPRAEEESHEQRVARETEELAARNAAMASYSDATLYVDPTNKGCWLQGSVRFLDRAEASVYGFDPGERFCVTRFCGTGAAKRDHRSCTANLMAYTAAVKSGLLVPASDAEVAQLIGGGK